MSKGMSRCHCCSAAVVRRHHMDDTVSTSSDWITYAQVATSDCLLATESPNQTPLWSERRVTGPNTSETPSSFGLQRKYEVRDLQTAPTYQNLEQRYRMATRERTASPSHILHMHCYYKTVLNFFGPSSAAMAAFFVLGVSGGLSLRRSICQPQQPPLASSGSQLKSLSDVSDCINSIHKHPRTFSQTKTAEPIAVARRVSWGSGTREYEQQTYETTPKVTQNVIDMHLS